MKLSAGIANRSEGGQWSPGLLLQRKCDCGNHTMGGACNDCAKKKSSLQRKATSNSESSAVPTIVNDVLRSPGQPLEAATRAFMEPRFGRDFSDVRVHADSRAAHSARAVGALAYTLGRDLVFGSGLYAPHTPEGKTLLAHELTHAAQNGGAQTSHSAPISIGPPGDHLEAEADAHAHEMVGGNFDDLSPRAITRSAEPGRLSRATMTVGTAKVDINYGNVINIPTASYESTIESNFENWSGSPAATIHTELTPLSDTAKEWVMFALDLLIDNPVAGLNKILAVKRLIAYAPSAKFRGLGTADTDFENEALSVSGWFEKAVTSGLTAPSGARLSYVRKRLNPDTSSSATSSCPSPRDAADQLDTAKLESDLPPKLEAYLKTVSVATNVKNQPMSPLLKVADAVQARARTYYSPYADRSRGAGNTLVQQWQYSSHVVSSQSSAGTPTTQLRLAYLDSRARIVGDKGLFSQVHFDPRCDADDTALEGIVTRMETQTTIQALIDPILRQKSYTEQRSKAVVLNTQVSAQTDDCKARWDTVHDICHELMHVMVHDDFRRADKGRQIMREGFPEVLGHYLYENIARDAGMKKSMEEGLASAPCESVPSSKIGYDPAGPDAEKIRVLVKNDNFRAAFFLGQLNLVGIQPKRFGSEPANDPHEIEADNAARAAIESRTFRGSIRPSPFVVDAGLMNVGTGQQIEPHARREMETRLGQDFTRVRVHTDARASESADSLRSMAYTVGNDIIFGAGQYRPSTPAGRRLLAHELTHVVQQSGGKCAAE